MLPSDSPENVASPVTRHSSRVPSLSEHLADWGLQHFTSDEAYFQWQREVLSVQELRDLHCHVERKRSGDPAGDVAFYDLTAGPRILPVLYSQRYEYYSAVGPRVAARIGHAQTVLDFGCGAGILTTFYARQCPSTTFVGIDRSAACVERAREWAAACGVTNVRFDCVDVEARAPAGPYDLIVASHALVQAEQDPGLPSRDWTTFERARIPAVQRQFEERTGIGLRLDRLCDGLAPAGRMIVFEKTRQLARRVPFQRALAARDFALIEAPEPVRYRTIEEVSDDGPFYVMQRGAGNPVPWNEAPEPDEGVPFEPAVGAGPSNDPRAPLYENHWPSAQLVWQRLASRSIVAEVTDREPDGRQLHVELGTAEGYAYLYCANTFDQRQLVVVEPARRDLLQTYYDEITARG